jgi:CheY-like chemotaxis protein
MKQQGLTILVLEDEQSLRAAIKSKLDTEGFNVATAKTVKQALDYLKEGIKIDGVWLDHYLFGRETGLDFVATLKANRLWKNLPVFVVSNTASSAKVQSYRKLGVQQCYTKVDHRLDTIIADIKKFLEGHKP